MSGETTDAMSEPGVLPVETLRFLCALHPEPHGLIELRLIFHNKDNPRPRSHFFASVNEVEAAAKQFMADNAAGHHVFAGVCLRHEASGKKEAVAQIDALWADLDAKDYSNDVDEGKRQEFYRIMVDDSDRLLGTIEQVLRAGQLGVRSHRASAHPIDFGATVEECLSIARTRYQLPPEALTYRAAGK